MTLLVVAEVAELKTHECPLLMVKKLVGFLVGALEIVSVVLFVKDHKQAVNQPKVR